MNFRSVLVNALVAGAFGFAAFGASAESVKVGIITDHTGDAADYTKLVEKGVALALKEVNEAGGVLGTPLELVWENDENKPPLSATKAHKLVDAGVPLIVQLSASPAVLQAESVTLETKTPHLAPNQSGDTLTTKLDNPYFFQMGPLGSIQIKTLMAFARSKYKRVALVTDNSGLGILIKDTFKAGLQQAGIEIVSETIIETGSTDAVPQLQRLRASNPEAVFQASVTTSEMALFFRGYRQLGLNYPVLGSFNLSLPIYLELLPGMLDGVYFVDVYDPDKPETKAFIAKYEKEFHEPPYSLPAYGYDAIRLVADVIKRAGSTDKEKIREAFASTRDFHTVIGAKGTTVSFSAQDRRGFPQNGAVVRVIENNKHGPVVFAGF